MEKGSRSEKGASGAVQKSTASASQRQPQQSQPQQAAQQEQTGLIGETAGKIWHRLKDGGEMEASVLIEQVGASTEIAQRAIGWLARENKVEISRTGRKEKIKLR
jgi:hypothetical protein